MRPPWRDSWAQRWVAGATWASSAWEASSHAVAVVNTCSEDEYVVAMRDNHFGYMCAASVLVSLTCLIFACTCFVLGWLSSNYWHDRREMTRSVTRPTPHGRRAMRNNDRQDSEVQCKRPCTDLAKINRLTIDSIRQNLIYYGEPTHGTKDMLAERLRVARLRNDELVTWRRQSFSSDSGGEE